jgi:voltage-gated potassium channel
MWSGLRGFRRDGGYERWERWTDWPLVVLAVVFLAVLILPLAHPVSTAVARTLDAANLSIWAAFAANYLFLLWLSLDRRRYLRTHILDLLVVVLPFMRPFRLLRLIAIVATTTRRAGGRVVQRVTVFTVCMAVLIAAVSAVVVYDAEKDAPGGNISTLGDGLWWALSTVTTVGYGDKYPVTPTGRLMALLLMVTGIALVGTLTAAVAAWFVHVVRSSSQQATAPLLAAEVDLSEQISDMSESLAALRAELGALTLLVHAGSAEPPSPHSPTD